MSRSEVIKALERCAGSKDIDGCEGCLQAGKCPYTLEPDNKSEWVMVPARLIRAALDELRGKTGEAAKVIEGLKCHFDPVCGCDACPYQIDEACDDCGWQDLKYDAIALIRGEEGRRCD